MSEVESLIESVVNSSVRYLAELNNLNVYQH